MLCNIIGGKCSCIVCFGFLIDKVIIYGNIEGFIMFIEEIRSCLLNY